MTVMLVVPFLLEPPPQPRTDLPLDLVTTCLKDSKMLVNTSSAIPLQTMLFWMPILKSLTMIMWPQRLLVDPRLTSVSSQTSLLPAMSLPLPSLTLDAHSQRSQERPWPLPMWLAQLPFCVNTWLQDTTLPLVAFLSLLLP